MNSVSARCWIIVFALFVFASPVFAQGDNTPTGAAGGWGGTINTGGGSFDPDERNATRSITDMVVPGAIIPLTYTRIFNSCGKTQWRHNWKWDIEVHERYECGPGCGPNDLFFGYYVNYPDGRRVQFNKPGNVPAAAPGTYTAATGILDRFVIDADGAHGHLFMSDGSVLNFDVPTMIATSLVDPHGRAITFTTDSTGTIITEPGGRWIHIGFGQYANNAITSTVTSSLGQSVSYTELIDHTGTYADTVHDTFTYNDVVDSATGQPVQARYEYQKVQPPAPPPPNPTPQPFNRLFWASDPMFDGPLKQIKYLYVDSWTQTYGDPTLKCVREEWWAANPTDTGVMVNKVEMPANATWNTESYYRRTETHGDGAVRTLSYWNPTTNQGQMLADHFTDFTNNTNVTERHEYDMTHMFHTPTRITDMRNNVTNQTLESVLGNITRETHPDTSYLSWTYTDPAYPYYVATKKDELGNTTTYTRDPTTHLVTRIDHPDGSYETYTYNNFGQVLTHRLPSSAVQNFEYDGRGLLLREWNSNDGYAARKEYTYDAWDRVLTIQDGRARAAGALYSVKYEYNGRHQITKTHYPATGGSSDPTVTNVYDKWGRCTSTTDELGNTTTMVYDDYGRMTSKTQTLNAPNWNNTGTVASRTWNWTYERVRNGAPYAANTHVAKEWRTQTEPAFDKDGNRRMTVREYDVNNRLVTEQTGWIVSPGGTATYGADGETHSFTYDANGNKASSTDPLNRLTSYAYDSRNRLTTTTEPLNRITTTAYDAVSNKTLVTFPDGKTQQWLYYDAFGQPGAFIDERGNTTGFWYWPYGPMKILGTVGTYRDKDGGGIETQYTNFYPDLLGRPQQTQFPDNSWERTFYEFGQPKTVQVRKGPQKTINYDARGRETSHTWNDGQTSGVTRTWDDAGRVTSLANIFSTIVYTYDGAGQAITESNTVTGSGGTTVLTTYRYPDGNPATLVYPNGFRFRRDYTARAQLLSTGSSDSSGNWLTQFASYSYLADGKVNYETYGNGVRTDFGYDGRGFTNVTNTYRQSPQQTYSNRTYYRDTRDRISAWAKSNTPANNPLENGRGDCYTYDPEGQLTAASYQALTPNTTPTGAQRTESFVYDALGNRKGVNTIAGRGNITFLRKDNGLNQYLPSGSFLCHYDDEFAPNAPGLANGVLVQDGDLSSEENALNQPRWIWTPAITPDASGLLWFGYDPLGRCVKRYVAPWSNAPVPNVNPATYFYYDGWNLIQEGPNSSGADRIYAHGNRVDEIVASQYGGAWRYHHYDARGHCILLTDASGAIVEQYDYNAFGKPYFYDAAGVLLPNGSGVGNRFLFTGREWMKDIGVYDFRNRHYLPELGRFIQPDPKEFEAGDYNLYRYCHNDPVNKSDPTGLLGWNSDGRMENFKKITVTEYKVTTEYVLRTGSLIPDKVTTTFGYVTGVGGKGEKALDSKTFRLAVAAGHSVAATLLGRSQNDPVRQGFAWSAEVEQNDQDHNQVRTLPFTRGVMTVENGVLRNGSPIHWEQRDEGWHIIAHVYTEANYTHNLMSQDVPKFRQAQIAGIMVTPPGPGQFGQYWLNPYNPPKN